MATGLPSQPIVEGETPRTITLHILCQSLPPPSRFTLENVPLSSTVGQLKSRIEQSFPNNPQVSHQRLIYRGKPLTVDDATLGVVVSSIEVSNSFLTRAIWPILTERYLFCRKALIVCTSSYHLNQHTQKYLLSLRCRKIRLSEILPKIPVPPPHGWITPIPILRCLQPVCPHTLAFLEQSVPLQLLRT